MNDQIYQSYPWASNPQSYKPDQNVSSHNTIVNFSEYGNLASYQNAHVQEEGLIAQHLLSHLGAQKYQLKCEQDARCQQASQLKAALQTQHSVLADNRKLNDMLKPAWHELSVLKLQLKSDKSKDTAALKAVLQNEKTLIAANKKLIAENVKLTESLEDKKIQLSSEKSKSEQQISELKENLSRANYELKHCQAHVYALTAINEMLIIGNEKRDEKISQYKRKLHNYNNISTLTDSESQSEDNSTVQVGQEAQESLEAESYGEFHRHLCELNKQSSDLHKCELCGWPSSSEQELQFKMF